MKKLLMAAVCIALCLAAACSPAPVLTPEPTSTPSPYTQLGGKDDSAAIVISDPTKAQISAAGVTDRLWEEGEYDTVLILTSDKAERVEIWEMDMETQKPSLLVYSHEGNGHFALYGSIAQPTLPKYCMIIKTGGEDAVYTFSYDGKGDRPQVQQIK